MGIARTVALVSSIGAISAACMHVAGPSLECRAVDLDRCRALAEGLIAAKRIERPDRRIVAITIYDDAGSHQVTYDDGSTEAVVP